jgi:hypothetical protein
MPGSLALQISNVLHEVLVRPSQSACLMSSADSDDDVLPAFRRASTRSSLPVGSALQEPSAIGATRSKKGRRMAEPQLI